MTKEFVFNQNPKIPLTFDIGKSIANNAINSFFKQVTDNFSDKLSIVIKTNLVQFGYLFDSEEEFLTFCQDRITQVQLDTTLDVYYFYLDFKDLENLGTYIGSYSNKLTFEGNTVQMNIEFNNQKLVKIDS